MPPTRSAVWGCEALLEATEAEKVEEATLMKCPDEIMVMFV
jgi:hypothetical protein